MRYGLVTQINSVLRGIRRCLVVKARLLHLEFPREVETLEVELWELYFALTRENRHNRHQTPDKINFIIAGWLREPRVRIDC
jgi:hypothetical protein